jgi:hypothetical protein
LTLHYYYLLICILFSRSSFIPVPLPFSSHYFLILYQL